MDRSERPGWLNLTKSRIKANRRTSGCFNRQQARDDYNWHDGLAWPDPREEWNFTIFGLGLDEENDFFSLWGRAGGGPIIVPHFLALLFTSFSATPKQLYALKGVTVTSLNRPRQLGGVYFNFKAKFSKFRWTAADRAGKGQYFVWRTGTGQVVENFWLEPGRAGLEPKNWTCTHLYGNPKNIKTESERRGRNEFNLLLATDRKRCILHYIFAFRYMALLADIQFRFCLVLCCDNVNHKLRHQKPVFTRRPGFYERDKLISVILLNHAEKTRANSRQNKMAKREQISRPAIFLQRKQGLKLAHVRCCAESCQSIVNKNALAVNWSLQNACPALRRLRLKIKTCFCSAYNILQFLGAVSSCANFQPQYCFS